MHLKRKTIPTFWPVQRTGTKYLSVASHEKENSIPLIVVLRDILNLVKTKKELKGLLHKKLLSLNGKVISELNYPVLLFDSLGIPSIKKYYKVNLKNKKFAVEEISEKESLYRIYKIIGKTKIANGKLQLNLNSGRNIISSEKINVGDFILLDNNNKIIKIMQIKKDSEVIAVKGKHISKHGKVKTVEKIGNHNIALIHTKEGDVKVNINNLFVTE